MQQTPRDTRTPPEGGAAARRILLVEDDAQLVSAMARGLDRFGYSVTTVTRVDEAVAKLEAGPFHVVVTDIDLPGQSGHALLRLVRERWPETPIVMMSGVGDIDDVIEAFRGGVMDYLRKPFSASELVRVIEAVLAKTAERETARASPPPPAPVVETAAATAAAGLDPSATRAEPVGTLWSRPKNLATPTAAAPARSVEDIIVSLVGDFARQIDAAEVAPPSPEAALEDLLALQSQPNLASSQVVRAIESSQAIVGRVLKTVNTAFFRGQRPVSNVKDAVIRLGNRSVLNEALTVLHRRTFDVANAAYAALLQRMWRSTSFIANVARELGRGTSSATGDPEDVYLAALMHRVGEAVTVRHVAGKVRPDATPDLHALSQAISHHYQRIGIAVLTSWKVPERCIRIAATHRALGNREIAFLKPAEVATVRLLALAYYVADKEQLGSPVSPPPSIDPEETISLLGIQPGAVEKAIQWAHELLMD